jgi:hypothetical protein
LNVIIIINFNLKWEKNQQQLKQLNQLIEKPEEEEFKPSPSISIKFLNKSTQILEFPKKP